MTVPGPRDSASFQASRSSSDHRVVAVRRFLAPSASERGARHVRMVDLTA
jgi:hypothetical protein